MLFVPRRRRAPRSCRSTSPTPSGRRSRPCATSSPTAAWDEAGIAAAIKETLAAHGLKMPQLAPAVRVLVCGRAQTPSLDAVLALFPREVVQERLRKAAASARYNRRAFPMIPMGV